LPFGAINNDDNHGDVNLGYFSHLSLAAFCLNQLATAGDELTGGDELWSTCVSRTAA